MTALTLLLAVLATLILLLSAALAWTLLRLHRRVEAVHARLGHLPALPLALPAAGRPMISIEILNPLELALRETALAGAASKLAPRMLERIVYSRAAGQIAEQLKAQGVRAQVRAHVA
ncbi:MAG: hypothetical protein NVS9B10_06600 [Nevskia sp.]